MNALILPSFRKPSHLSPAFLDPNFQPLHSQKQKNDVNNMDSLLAGICNVFKPDDYDFTAFTEKDIKTEEISTSPKSRTFLCFLILKTPLNYKDDKPVDVKRTV